MKQSVITLFTFLIVFTSCSSDDDYNFNEVLILESEIPTAIKTYIETHFSSNSIVRAKKETDNKTLIYEIFLSENFNLEFNSTFNIIEIDGVSQLPNSVIPQLILDYVASNYPNNFITDWELETNHQQVELNNDIELEFDVNGNFIRIGNLNDLPLANTNIPAKINEYITTHFASNSILRAIKETDNNTITYEIYLSNAITLEFNSTFNIIEIDGVSQLPNSVIPQLILDYVASNYPNNFITDWELETNHQQVELNNDIELEFEMNGNFIRIDND